MNPRIETLSEKKLIGKKIMMSFSENKTLELWRGFMPRRQEIKNTIGSELYSLEVYPPGYFNNFNPNTPFEKWATLEATNFDTIPNEMETILIPTGLYAIFLHKGPASEGAKTYEYIFRTWIPNSDYIVDERPHFAVMGEKYKQDNPSSEEDIWIPIKKR